MVKKEKPMNYALGMTLGLLALLVSGASAKADVGLMHPFGSEPARLISPVSVTEDKEHGVLSLNAYHVIQPVHAEKSVPVHAVSSGKIYAVEETKDEGIKIFVEHDDGGRASYSFLDKETLPELEAKLNKGDIIGYTASSFDHKLKYELVANTGHIVRHDFGQGRNRQNFVYTSDDIGFAFYNPNPLGGASSPNASAAPDNAPTAQNSGNFYASQPLSMPNSTGATPMNEYQVEEALCPSSVMRALQAQAEVKLLNIERIRGLIMTEPASIKTLACHDMFVRDMATNVATTGIFGQIINIFGPNGNQNLNFGNADDCEGASMVWNIVSGRPGSSSQGYGLDQPRRNAPENAHRNIMYPGLGNSHYNPLHYPSVMAPLYAPNLSTYMASYFQPGSRAQNIGTVTTPNFYPINPSWDAGEAARQIKTSISGQPVTIPRSATYP